MKRAPIVLSNKKMSVLTLNNIKRSNEFYNLERGWIYGINHKDLLGFTLFYTVPSYSLGNSL